MTFVFRNEKMEFKYCKNPDAEIPIFCIEEQVGTTAGEEDEAEKVESGIVGSIFSQEIKFIDNLGKKGIEVHINSQGGFVKDGYSIFFALNSAKTPVTTICTGMAASIAGIIFEAGKIRKMTDYSFIMIHNPSGGEDEELNIMRDGLVKILSKRAGMTPGKMSELMDQTSYIPHDEALTLGLCDEILETQVADKLKNEIKTMLSVKAPNLTKVLNKLTDIKNDLNKQPMKKVIAFLNTKCKAGLATDADESDVLDAVKDLYAAKNEADKEKDKAEDAKKTMEEKCDELEGKMKGLEKDSKEYKALKKEMDDLKEEAKNLVAGEDSKKAEDAVNEAVKLGKIKDTAKEKVLAQYKKDPEGTQLILDEMPVNRKSATIPAENIAEVDATTGRGNFMAKAMAERIKKAQVKA